LVGDPVPDFFKAFSKVIPFWARAASKEFSLGGGVGLASFLLVVPFVDETDLVKTTGTAKLAAVASLLGCEQTK